MFELIGNLKEKKIQETKEINLNTIKEGINNLENLIIVKIKDKLKVYDRKCDHAGGKLISRENKIICPIHNWEFLPTIGKYTNNIVKRETPFKVKNNKIILLNNSKVPIISSTYKNTTTNIRFFNHAFLTIQSENFSFATDPWAYGPAFNNGWWLKSKTKEDWMEKLNECSFIYISHNHPDHLHPLTLSHVRKDMKIIVPKFKSDSTGIFLEKIGFKNIERLDFKKEYRLKYSSLIFSLLKSGDFREDSGILFSNGKLKVLIDVDSNNINFNEVPEVDIYCSSFAGGASGYPLCFNNYDLPTKKAIHRKGINFLRKVKIDSLKKIKPRFFLPYAGFFETKLKRDNFIKSNNEKNTISNYNNICEELKIKLLNVEKNDKFKFVNGNLEKKEKTRNSFFNDLGKNSYLKLFKEKNKKISFTDIKNYFKNSNFNHDLILIMSLCNDDFKKINEKFYVDFSRNEIIVKELTNINSFIKKIKSQRYLYINCRKESFINTLKNNLPWDDLLIGFQCQIERNPNIYNWNFWFHFSNIYTTKNNVREVKSCGNCKVFEDKVNNELYSLK